MYESQSLHENRYIIMVIIIPAHTVPGHQQLQCWLNNQTYFFNISLDFDTSISPLMSNKIFRNLTVHWKFIVNSLTPGKFKWSFRYVIFKWILVIDGWVISCEIALIWMSLDSTDDQSTLVQVMAWCHQATSHYLSQCWPRSLPPYGVTRPHWSECHITSLMISEHWSR